MNKVFSHVDLKTHSRMINHKVFSTCNSSFKWQRLRGNYKVQICRQLKLLLNNRSLVGAEELRSA